MPGHQRYYTLEIFPVRCTHFHIGTYNSDPGWRQQCVKEHRWTCRILTSLSLGGSYPRLLGREKLWTTASFPYLGAGRTQLQPMRSWYFYRTSDVTLGDYGRAVGRSL